jgi:large subunit ribosomal protein L25
VSLKIPIRLIGTPRGVLEGGGRMFRPLSIIRIKVLPDRIPAEFTIDVSNMNVGEMLRISDLKLEGIVPLDSPTRTIVAIRSPKGERAKGAVAPAVTEEDAEEEVTEAPEGGSETGSEEAAAE